MNRLKEYFMDETDDLTTKSQTEKEALCFRLLVERDKINEKLKKVQETMEGV